MHDLMQLHGYQKLAGLLHFAFASLSCSSPTPAARAQAGMLRPDGEVVLRPMSDASFAQAQRVLHVLSCAALFPKLQLSWQAASMTLTCLSFGRHAPMSEVLRIRQKAVELKAAVYSTCP